MASDSSAGGSGRSECTDKLCQGTAKFALWLGDEFSRVFDAHESMPYHDGDLHPHVCEACLPDYEDLHGDKGEFVRPVEKLVADGGSERIETPSDPFDRLVLNPAASVEASGNPLCPDCEEPIQPWANQYERRFVCGCDETKRFQFKRSVDAGIRGSGGETDGDE